MQLPNALGESLDDDAEDGAAATEWAVRSAREQTPTHWLTQSLSTRPANVGVVHHCSQGSLHYHAAQCSDKAAASHGASLAQDGHHACGIAPAVVPGNPCETHTAVISIDATLTHAASSSSLLPARASTLVARLYTITACPGTCCYAVHRSARRSPHAVPACACSFLCLTVQADACTSCEPFDFELTIAHIMPAVTPRHLYGTWSSCWSASPWMQQATILMPACASLSFEHWACWPSPCGECVHPTRPVAPAAS